MSAFLKDGFEYKGVEYRAMTASTLAILEIVESPFFTGVDQGIKGLLDYLLVHSMPTKDARKLARDKEDWDNRSFDLGDTLSADDLEELGGLVTEQSELIAKSVVEEGNAKGKK